MEELLKQLCEIQDISLLETLPAAVTRELKSQSIDLLRRHVGKRSLMKKILAHQELNDAGRPFKKAKEAHERGVNAILNKFCVQITGARSGDVIVGASQGTSGAVMRIMQGNIYPEKGKLDLLRQHPDLWHRFRLRLKGLPFFSSMSNDEIDDWLSLHEDSYHNELIVGDVETQVLLQVLQPGKLTEKIKSTDIDLLVMGNPSQEDGWWTGKEIENMIPSVPGSKARKHTLAMCRFSWKLSHDYELLEEYEGGISDIYGELDNERPFFVLKDIPAKFKKVKSTWRAILKNRISIGVQSPRTPALNCNIVSKEDLDKVSEIMRNLGPAAYKSLIQKLVRFRPRQVVLQRRYFEKVSEESGLIRVWSESNTVVNALWLLRAVVIKLILIPGSFVPDIQRYVSGKEACFKRLGVIITEDAYADPTGIATCFTAALLSQRVKSWNPSDRLLEIAIDAVCEAFESNKFWNWDWRKGMRLKPLTINPDQTSLQRSSAILTEIRSFPSDIGFLRYMADHPDDVADGKTDRPAKMHIGHCVDQHWAPNVVYFYDYQVVKSEENSIGKPFAGIFRKLWDKSSSMNPRKSDEYLGMFEDEFVLHTRAAQDLFLVAKQQKKFQRKIIPNKKHWIDVHLPIGWLAAMVGVIEISGRVTALVTMSADDPYHLIAVRRPSRNSTDPLTDDQKQTAITKALVILKRGVMMNSTKPPIDIFKGASVKLRDSAYIIILSDGSEKTWSELADTRIGYNRVARVKKVSSILETLDPRNLTFREFEWALIFTGDGVVKNYERKIRKAIAALPSSTVRRILFYLSTYDTKIEMYPVGREGGGTHQTVTVEDVSAYQSLVMLSTLCPAAFTPTERAPGRFKVHSPPLLWHVKDIIQTVEAGKKTDWKGQWNPISDSSNRELWPHQTEALADMIENFEAGNKGSFLWLKVGLGKTLIVMYFVKYLIEQESLPPYFVYTLPNSAVDSVLKEIEVFDLPITFLVPLKTMSKAQKKIWTKRVGVKHILKRGCVPDKYRVNIITTDGHLRKCRQELSEIASESFLVFDEVHKNMNDSQRTTTAQELASLANIFAAFTGTPVIDSKTYKLNAWLSRIVPFEVNNSNYLVAANTMITRSINTGIEVFVEDVVAIMTEEELKIYNMLVPPRFGGTNANPVPRSWKEAIDLCYDVCDKEMVLKTTHWVLWGSSEPHQDYYDDERGVMLVARNGAHQEKLLGMLVDRGVAEKDIFVMSKGKSLILTDQTVSEGEPDYKVVIVRMSQPEGYTLTRLSVMISSVYPSNRASRVQIEGRINRIGQYRDIIYTKVHTGLLTFILQRHKDAKSLEAVLQEVSRHI